MTLLWESASSKHHDNDKLGMNSILYSTICSALCSLLLKAAQNPIYHHFLDEAVAADDHFETPR